MDVLDQIIADLPETNHPAFQNTIHETMFGIMFPGLLQQVTFGTGKGGLAKWGSKKYVADFFDSSTNTIFEIDGTSHNSKYRKVSDKLRDRFFESKGVKTIRISNWDVEQLYVQYMKEDVAINEKKYRQGFNKFLGS